MINLTKVNLEKLQRALRKHVGKWVAISGDNKIVSSAATYRKAVDKVSHPEDVVLFRVTPMDASIAPTAR
jgi:hypothetical protein